LYFFRSVIVSDDLPLSYIAYLSFSSQCVISTCQPVDSLQTLIVSLSFILLCIKLIVATADYDVVQDSISQLNPLAFGLVTANDRGTQRRSSTTLQSQSTSSRHYTHQSAIAGTSFIPFNLRLYDSLPISEPVQWQDLTVSLMLSHYCSCNLESGYNNWSSSFQEASSIYGGMPLDMSTFVYYSNCH